MSQRPVLMAIVCWREEMQEDAWQRLGQSYQVLRGPLQQVGLWQPLPPVSPLLPWICVWLTPYITLADVGQAMAFATWGRTLHGHSSPRGRDRPAGPTAGDTAAS